MVNDSSLAARSGLTQLVGSIISFSGNFISDLWYLKHPMTGETMRSYASALRAYAAEVESLSNGLDAAQNLEKNRE